MATDMQRRTFLNLTAGAVLGAGLGFGGTAFANAGGTPRLLTAARIDGRDGGALWSEAGLSDFALPGRAHAVTRLSGERYLLTGRRTGRFAAMVDNIDAAPRLLTPLADHRFAGHAATHGALLVTAENEASSAAGALVLRDAASGTILDRWDAVGIETHDLVFARGGEVLVVALGGIAKDASVRGPAMNAGHVESAIVEIDVRFGRVLHRHVLPRNYASLSMRHMALAPDGETIVFGMQDQDYASLKPLMGLLRLGRGLELFDLPKDDPATLRFYVGSVAIDASGSVAAVTSPKGGAIALWSLRSGRSLGHVRLADVCGLAAGISGGEFWATTGLGDVVRLDVTEDGGTIGAHWHAEAQFDNHLLAI